MYYIYNGKDVIVDVKASPVAAKFVKQELQRNGDPDVYIQFDEGAR